MILFLVPFLLLPVPCLGFFWTRADGSLRNEENAKTQIVGHLSRIDDILTREEVNSLHSDYEALQSYSRKPDCFKSAASLIRTRCADLDMDEEARVNAAISMTLCEIATAKHHSIPLECKPYSFGKSVQRMPATLKIQGECVDALSRSAQFWSSYSGYLREVPQLCHAFRRWNDIDLAKDIYHNATIEQISFIRSIINREQTITKYTDKWSEISMGMERTANEIRALSEKHQTTTDEYTLRLEGQTRNALKHFWETAQEVITRRSEAETTSASQLGIALNNVAISHSDELTRLVESFHHLLDSRLDYLASAQEVRYQQIDHAVSVLEERWRELGLQFNGMKQSLVVFSDQSTEISRELGVSILLSHNIRDLTSEAHVTASGLVDTLAHLTETANNGLDMINGSAHLIGRQLQVHIEQAEGKDSDIWMLWLIRMAGKVIFGADSDVFELFNEHHMSFRVLLSALGFGWAAFRACFSTVSTVSMLLFLATRKIVMRKLAHVFSSILNLSATPVAPDLRNTAPQKVAFTPELPMHALDDVDYRYSRRVSRIPTRSWNP